MRPKGFCRPIMHRPQWRVPVASGDRRPWFPACDCGYLCRRRVELFDTASAAVGPRAGNSDVATQIDTALELMDRHVDVAGLLAQLTIPHPYGHYTTDVRLSAAAARPVRTSCASSFPKGTTILLKSAGRLLQRGIVDHPGDEAKVRLRAAELGVDLDGATVIEPCKRTARSIRRPVCASCVRRRNHRGACPQKS